MQSDNSKGKITSQMYCVIILFNKDILICNRNFQVNELFGLSKDLLAVFELRIE